jgi:tetratricopeptide (TPR) repeat protein
MSIIPLLVLNIAEKVKKLNLASKDIVGSAYSWSEYSITQLRTVLSYIRLLILPYNQNFDPDYPLYRTLLDPEIIISIFIWVIILVSAVRLLQRDEKTLYTDLAGFSVFWFILSISVSSSFIPLSDLMFEHHTYLPSLAFCTGSVAYIHHVCIQVRPVRQHIFFAGLCLIVITFEILTVKRNLTYSSNLSIWSDTVKKSPKKGRPYCWLGDVYFENNLPDKAIPYYKKTLAITPDDIAARLQLGESYRLTNRSEAAIELYKQYLNTHPPERRILENLSWTYANSGMIPEAIDTTRSLLGIVYNKVNLLSYMAELHLRGGNLREATRYLAEAREADRLDTTVDISTKLNQLEKQIQSVSAVKQNRRF